MQIRNINQVIHTNGDTSDIINVVMMAYEVENDPQIADLAETLKADTIRETCRNIWAYLVDAIDYRADADGNAGELIRTPARLIHDGTGDCKSYSLFTAVVLRYLGIDHVFRFASYSSRREATHVYIVAFDGDTEIIIDAVAKEQLNKDFDTEIKYTYKCDMANSKTKISYLAGLPGGNAIGNFSPDDDERYAVWIGDDNEAGITPGKAYLYGRYDLLSEQLNIAATNSERARLYNELSVIAAHLWAYNYVFGETDKFDDMALIIAGLVADGLFESNELDAAKRDDWFDNILFTVEQYYLSGNYPKRYSEAWYKLITENVTEQNTVSENIGAVGGWTPIANGLKKAGIYFLYLFIPANELSKYPASVAKKRNVQNTFYTLVHKIDIFHSASTVMGFFRSGIIARTGMEPEKYIAEVKLKNVKSVGSVSLATITGIISLVLGLIEIIKAIWPNSDAAKYAVSSGAADMENELFTEKRNNNSTGSGLITSASGWLPFAGIALGAFLLFRKKSN